MTRSASFGHEIEALERLDLDGLRALWRERYGAPSGLRSEELLRLCLAWRLQAQALGGLDRQTRRRLKNRSIPKTKGQNLGIGAKLSREWQGEMIEVVVEAKGFRWNDKTWPSLSAIARAATGTRWNGPRFFGLRSS
ncbi:MAG: DUF2924 domain-containing protein [Geminicoccaceae bacterium]